MRTALCLLPLLLAAPAARADDDAARKEVRAFLSEKPEKRDEWKSKILAREGLDWKVFREAAQAGRYYQNPLVTERGERGSGKHFGLTFNSGKGGFIIYVPRAYDAQAKTPLLVYLHHDSGSQRQGSGKAGIALFKFKEICERENVLFLAPYTMQGAEWWTPEGARLVRWALGQIKDRYNVDEDRTGLMGALDGGDACWYLGQEMPDTWSVLMPMTGDAYEVGAMIRRLYLGTLDRMDVFMGVTGKINSRIGAKDTNQFFDSLKPMFGKRMRITAAVYPGAQSDFQYLSEIQDQAVAFLKSKKRKPLAKEVDVETDAPSGQRSLWLETHGYDKDGDVAHNFNSTLLTWTPPKRHEAKKRIGVQLQKRPGWTVGRVITGVPGHNARRENITGGDILVAVDGEPVTDDTDLAKLLEKHDWEDEIHLVLAREVKESDLERARKRQRQYLRVREKIRQLKAEGKEVPRDRSSLIEEEETAGGGNAGGGGGAEDEGDGLEMSDDGLEVGGDPKPQPKIENEPTVFHVFDRWVTLRRSEGALVRADFGASWDPQFRERGVRLIDLVPGGQADRSGFKLGDVIVQIGSVEVKAVRDLQSFFEEFQFEKEPEGERWVECTIKRQDGQGQWTEHDLRLDWEPATPHRVDAQWDAQDRTMKVLTRHAKGFSLYFTDEMLEPGQEWHLFVNNIPYKDLVDPASAPEYPEVTIGSDPVVRDQLERLRRKRAKMPGWKPDFAWALEQLLEREDRSLVFGAKVTIDLAGLREGFVQARARREKRRNEDGARLQKAWEEHRNRSE